MLNMLTASDRYLGWIDMFFALLAAAAIVVMMGVTAVDVVMRYAFNAPLSWVFDLTTHYLLLAAFFLGLSYALRMNHHISVDFFARNLPARLYHPCMALGSLMAGGVFLWIAYLGGEVAYESWAKGDAMFGVVTWPTWPGKAVIPLGMAPLALRCAHRALAHLCAMNDEAVAARLEIGIDSHITPEE